MDYCQALLDGNSWQCQDMVQQLIDEGVPVPTLYTELFQQSLYQVGEMWQRNQISVAVEHPATAITERLLTQVSPHLLANVPPGGRRALISCSVKEYHQIGARMVADIMEARGWNVSFIGANAPLADLMQHIEANSLGRSASLKGAV